MRASAYAPAHTKPLRAHRDNEKTPKMVKQFYDPTTNKVVLPPAYPMELELLEWLMENPWSSISTGVKAILGEDWEPKHYRELSYFCSRLVKCGYLERKQPADSNLVYYRVVTPPPHAETNEGNTPDVVN